jgi:LysM repeat protein
MKANNIDDPKKLKIGQKIVIPVNQHQPEKNS